MTKPTHAQPHTSTSHSSLATPCTHASSQFQLYNTLTRQLEVFTPIDPQHVKIYTCGPTVYSYAHIGNFTSYIYWDLLIRTLQLYGYTPYRVLNLTDVGHLTSDSDAGQDKMEKGAQKEGKTVWEIAQHYSQAFLADYHALNLIEPEQICRATDYIPQALQLIDTLTQKGYTYQTSDGIYFDTSKFPNYAQLARLDLDHLKAGARVNFSSEKRNVSDFALWKFIQPGEHHAMRWDYLDRPGYPGWHLECSTIIHAALGEPIDIHTGGIDHIPVHHTNEIAQSEAAYDHQLCHYWLHCNHITIDGQKASKSLGNTYTLADLAQQGFTPMDFKLWVLQGHYQSERNFSFQDLQAAHQRLLSWRNHIAELRQTNPRVFDSHAIHTDDTDDLPSQFTAIRQAAGDNLNSAAICSIIDNHQLSYEDWCLVDQVLGLDLIASVPDITSAQKQLIAARETARKTHDYTTADTIRNQLAQANLTVKDTPHGPIWQFI